MPRRWTPETREAHRAYTRQHYRDNKDYYKAKAHNNVPITEKYIDDYLAVHPCVDCDEDDPIVLEFDHVRGTKHKAVSEMAHSNASLKAVIKEIEKCDVRCANCHRRATHQRKCSRRSKDRTPRYERGDLLVQVQPGVPS